MFEDQKILITGGTGSFGRTMVGRLLDTDCAEIRILSRDEWKQDEMRSELADPRLRYYVGDVRDPQSVHHAVQGADLVFHAAALKQVPTCEFFPMQAVMTNVEGSSNVIESSIHHGVRSVVCLSTDKAVYPINAMGMSKAMMEKVAQAACRYLDDSETVVSCVRYGNVMYSRGSVIPLFVKQIREGKVLTITEPSMTRFMLPLEHAVELVEFALTNANPGDVFIRKAPASTIMDLATALKSLFESDAPVEVIGIRHGEKIYETLATREELRRAEDMGDYFRVQMDDRDLDYKKYFVEGDTEEVLLEDYDSHNTRRLPLDELESLLLTLPEIQDELARAGVRTA